MGVWKLKFGRANKTSMGIAASLALLLAPVAAVAIRSNTSLTDSGSLGSSLSLPDLNEQLKTEASVSSSQSSSQQGGGSGSASVQIKVDGGGSESTDVTVNGQSIDVPENGTVRKQVTTDGSNAVVNVQIHNDGSASSDNKTTIKIQSSSDDRSNIDERHPRDNR